MSYADIVPGVRYRSGARTLTETDHALFMMLSGDWHPIHADEHYASTTPAGHRLMHGTFGITLAMGMQTSAVEFADEMLGALSLKEWTFRKPMLIGDTVRVEVEFLSKRITRDGRRFLVERRLTLMRQDDVIIQEGIATAMLRLPVGVTS